MKSTPSRRVFLFSIVLSLVCLVVALADLLGGNG
jgi:hypothetical protein